MPSTNNQTETNGVLASLRALIPSRRCSFSESLWIAELQAARLRELLDVREAAFPTDLVHDLPRIRVVARDGLPVSGLSYWTNGTWTIATNSSEPWQRQRLTLLHELKHIIDHGRTRALYAASHGASSERRGEQVADFFAGAALVPKRWLKQAYGQGVQRPDDLADLFGVSARAIEVRLAQTGLTETKPRCRPQPSGSDDRLFEPVRYQRLGVASWLSRS
jgi:hypothetical protein